MDDLAELWLKPKEMKEKVRFYLDLVRQGRLHGHAPSEYLPEDAEIWVAYEEAQRSQGLVDFDNMLLLFHRLLARRQTRLAPGLPSASPCRSSPLSARLCSSAPGSTPAPYPATALLRPYYHIIPSHHTPILLRPHRSAPCSTTPQPCCVPTKLDLVSQLSHCDPTHALPPLHSTAPHPSNSEALRRFRSMHTHFIVDEYQDNSQLQALASLALPLTLPATLTVTRIPYIAPRTVHPDPDPGHSPDPSPDPSPGPSSSLSPDPNPDPRSGPSPGLNSNLHLPCSWPSTT